MITYLSFDRFYGLDERDMHTLDTPTYDGLVSLRFRGTVIYGIKDRHDSVWEMYRTVIQVFHNGRQRKLSSIPL